jgi:hypothetical protein
MRDEIDRRLDRRKKWMAGLFVLALTLINAATVVQLAPYLQNGYQDFTAFYGGAELVRAGQTARLYDLAAMYREQMRFVPNVPIRQAALPYNHPPFEALIFVPFTYLGYWPAYLLWTFINALMLALSLGMVRKSFPEIGRLSPVFLVLAATGFVPLVIAFIQGQDSVLLLLLFTFALTSLEDGQDIAAGAALAVGLFKFQLALPMAMVLAVKRPRLLLGFFPVAVLLGAVSAMMVGWQGVADYVPFLLRLEKSGAGGAISALGMANLRGLAAELPGVNGASAHAMQLAFLLTLTCSIAMMGITLWQVRRRDASIRFVFSLASVTAVMVSYHANIHDLAWLVVIVLLLFSAPGAVNRAEMRRDTILLMTVYTIFWGRMLWPWLTPLWCVPVLIWIVLKFRCGHAAAATA